MTGEVDYVIVRQRLHARLAIRPTLFLEMRIATGQVGRPGSHVAQCRMVSHTERHTWVEGCGYQCQRTTLAASLHNHVLAVPLWKLCQNIDAAYQSQIDMFHVIQVTVLQSLTQIGIPLVVEGRTDFGKHLLAQGGVQSVDVQRHADKTVLWIETARGGIPDRLHTSPRRCQHHRARARLGTLGHQQIGIERMALTVQVYLQAPGIHLCI